MSTPSSAHLRTVYLLRSMLLALVVLPCAATASQLAAQSQRPGMLVGRVVDPEGTPVGNAILRATRGNRTVIAEAEDDGDFRIAGLGGGAWLLTVRRLGFAPLAVELELPASGLRRDFVLRPTTPALDPLLLAARWSGVRGVVGDARRIVPLAGATVRAMGSDAAASTDSLGNFALPLPAGRAIVLRVERMGFETRLVTASVPAEGYRVLEVPLDTAPKPAHDDWVWRELDQRLRYATPRALQVGREAIERSDAVSLGSALEGGRSVGMNRVIVTRRACLFVNGVAKPGFPVDAIRAARVEFVEAYPAGTDLTRTLAQRWPAGAICGVDDGTTTSLASVNRQVAQFVSVWLRAP